MKTLCGTTGKLGIHVYFIPSSGDSEGIDHVMSCDLSH